MADKLQLGIVISADGKAAEAALGRVGSKLQDVKRSTFEARLATAQYRATMDAFSGAAAIAVKTMASLGAALSARAVLAQADAYNQLIARLKLSSGTMQEFGRAMDNVRAIANRYQQEIDQIGSTYQRLAPAVQKLGMSQSDLRDILSAVSAGLKVSGTEAGAAAGFMTQFSQALNSNVVQAEEWNSIQDGNLALVNAMEKQLPDLIAKYGNLKSAVNAQAVSNETLADAVKGARAELEAQAAVMGTTVAGSVTVLKNKWEEYIGASDKATGGTKELSAAIINLSNNLETIMEPLGTFLHAVTGGAGIVKDFAHDVSNVVKEMVGLKDAGSIDQEIADLMRAGTGQKSIAEIAGFTPAASGAAGEFFDGIKRGAQSATQSIQGLTKAQAESTQVILDAASKAFKLNEKQKEAVAEITAVAEKNSFDPILLLSIAKVESSFDQFAKSTTSTSRGLFQFIQATRQRFGVKDPFNIEQATLGAIKYFDYLEKYLGNTTSAIAGYNRGEGEIKRAGGMNQAGAAYVAKVKKAQDELIAALGLANGKWDEQKDAIALVSAAYDQLKTHEDGLVKAAEDYAKVQVEKVKTSLAALEAERKAAQDVTAAQLASAQTYDDKQRLLAAAAQAQEQYHQRALVLTQQESDAQQQAIQARKKALQDGLAGADRYNISITEQAKLKQAIANADSDLAVLAQQRAQAEIAAGQQVNEASQQALALKQKEQDAIGGIIAEYEKQVEILNRLTQAQQAGASAEQLGLLSQYYGQAGQLPEVVSAEQLQRMQQYQLSTLAVKDAIQEMTKATLDQGQAEQSVREEQLRQNAYWDQLIGRLQDYARTWAEITGNQHDAFAEISVAMGQMLKNIEQVGQAYQDMQDRFAASHGGETSDVLGIASGIAEAEAALNGMARTLLAIRNQYEEGSQGYKDMTAAAERMMEVQRALSAIEAVLGVIHQFTSGDVYTAIPRAIGVAAMMASLGYQTGLGGGGSATAAYQAQPGQTGAVFGDGTAQSESIRKSLEIIRDNSSNDLNYSAAMLRALENIESAMAGATNSIIRGVGPSVPVGTKLGSIANAGQLDIGGLDFAAQMIGKFVFNVQREISDFGIHVLPHTIKKMFENGFQAASYTDVTTTTKVLGISVSESTHSYFQQLDTEVNKQFTGVITNIAKATKAAGAALGLSGDFMTERLNKFVIDVGRISLANLKGEELQKKLEEMFSTMSDQIAKAFVPGLGKFRQVGEGYFETMIRVAEGTQRATGELAQLGIEAIKFREITDKQKPVDQELFKQSYLASGRASEGLSQFIDRINGTAREIREAVEKFVRAEELLKTANLSISALLENPQGQSTLIDRVGGLDNLVGLLDDFNSNFLTEAQRTAGSLATLTNAFADLGVAMPSSKDAFYQLVQSLDLTTESGQNLFGGLLKLEGAFAKVADEVDRIKQKYADRLDPMAVIRKTLESVGTDFATLLSDAVTPIQAEMDRATGDLKGRQAKLDKEIADSDTLRDKLIAENEKNEEKLAELLKKPNKNAKEIVAVRARIAQNNQSIDSLFRIIVADAEEWHQLQQRIDDIIAKGGADMAKAKAPILANAATIMTETLADIMQGLAQTIQEAQQRLDNVLSFQRNLVTQIAQLQGTQAVADLANARYGQANSAVNDYIGAIGSGSRVRDTEEELRLLGDLQTAVMDRYNAEMALIQEGIQAQTNALNEALQVEIDNINAAAQTQVDAVNATLDAQINAINAASEAQIKAQQKADAEVLKGIQKQNDLAIKAAQKANDAIIKAQQKVYDNQIKALQKQQEAEVKALQKQQEAALQGWQDQLDAANTLRDAIKGIQEYAKSLLLGPQSTLSPEARLAEAQRQYQELAAKARGGDADALSKLSGSTDTYLEAAKQYYGSGSRYQSIFDGVKAAMDGLGAMSAPDPDSIQSHIDALRDAQETQLDALRESQADAVDALREQQGEQLDALRETLNEQIDLMREQQAEALDVVREQQAATIDAMREATQAQIEAARKAAQDQVDAIQKDGEAQIKAAQERTAQAIADLSDPNKNTAMKALKDETIKKLQEIHDLSEKTRAEAERKAEEARRLAAQQAADAIRIAKDQLARLDSGLTFSAAQIRALNGLMAGLNINYQEPVPTTLAGGSGLEGVAGYAGGGYAQAGMALVGEKGPELVRFERPAQVMTAEQTRKALSGDDGKTYQALEAIKGELRAIVTTQSGANPQIIGRLASIEGRLNAMEREQKLANSSPRRAVQT